MRSSLETRLGLFFALSMCVSVLLLETVGGAGFFRSGYEVTGHFDTVYELNIGDPVKLAGVRIGSVNGIELAEDVVVVTMKINHERELLTTTRARIKFSGLMGQNFVEVDFGTPDGVPIDPEIGALLETDWQPDVNVLMARLEGVAKGVEDMTKSFGGDALQSVLGPMADFMRDNSPKMGVILSNMELVSEKIADGEGTIGKTVMDDALYDGALDAATSIGRSTGKINSMLTDMGEIMTVARTSINDIESGRGTLGLLVKDEALYGTTTTAMLNLREMMEKMNNGDGTVGQLINEADFLASLTLMLQKVEKVTDGLEDQGPLSLIGMAFGSFIKF